MSQNISVRATCPGRSERTQPFSSTSTARPSSNAAALPEIQARDAFIASTKAHSVLKSVSGPRLVPIGDFWFFAVETGTFAGAPALPGVPVLAEAAASL